MKIINKTDDNILASFNNGFFVKIPSKNSVEVEFELCFYDSVILREEKSKLSFLGALLAFFIAIPLSIIHYFDYEKIDEGIKLPTRFFLVDKKPIHSFEIEKTGEKLKNYAIYINQKKVNSELFFTVNELKEEVKKYKYSNILTLLFPFLFFIVLDVYFLIIAQYSGAIAVLFVLSIMTFPILQRCIINRRIIKIITHKSVDCIKLLKK